MNRRGPGAWLFAGTVVTPSLILAACQPSETPPMLELLASPPTTTSRPSTTVITLPTASGYLNQGERRLHRDRERRGDLASRQDGDLPPA